MFKIICAGWNCADWITTTLDSIEMQRRRDFEVMVTYEGSEYDRGFQVIEDWVRSSREPGKYSTSFRVGEENFLYGTRARYEGIRELNPNDEDVVIWLNVDGDRFAHSLVVDHLWDAYFYDGFPLVTYGNFEPVPMIEAPLHALPYDNAVIANRSYRSAPFRAADLRTMKYQVFKEIPVDQFKWTDRDEWYAKVDDVTSMIPALELVGIRHRFVAEVLEYYNTANPFSGTYIAADETTACDLDFRAKPVLEQRF